MFQEVSIWRGPDLDPAIERRDPPEGPAVPGTRRSTGTSPRTCSTSSAMALESASSVG